MRSTFKSAKRHSFAPGPPSTMRDNLYSRSCIQDQVPLYQRQSSSRHPNLADSYPRSNILHRSTCCQLSFTVDMSLRRDFTTMTSLDVFNHVFGRRTGNDQYRSLAEFNMMNRVRFGYLKEDPLDIAFTDGTVETYNKVNDPESKISPLVRYAVSVETSRRHMLRSTMRYEKETGDKIFKFVSRVSSLSRANWVDNLGRMSQCDRQGDERLVRWDPLEFQCPEQQGRMRELVREIEAESVRESWIRRVLGMFTSSSSPTLTDWLSL